MVKAFAYTRVSGKGQLEGHGLERQHDAIQKYASNTGYQVTGVYSEEGISGTTDESCRPAFQRMVTDILRNGVSHVIVESLDRLARDLQVQLQLSAYCASKQIELISAATGENITQAIMEDPMRRAMVQIQGVFAELDKSLVVRKLKNGRLKARQDSETRTLSGKKKCEGRKSLRETNPELLERTRQLYRKPRKGRRRTLAEVGRILFEEGFSTAKGKAYAPAQIKRLLGC